MFVTSTNYIVDEKEKEQETELNSRKDKSKKRELGVCQNSRWEMSRKTAFLHKCAKRAQRMFQSFCNTTGIKIPSI